jgi:hypothetical protein
MKATSMMTPSAGVPELLGRLLEKVQDPKRSGPQAVAGIAGYVTAATPEALFNVFANVDSAQAGVLGLFGGITLVAIWQTIRDLMVNRRLCRRILRDPDYLLKALLRANRPDLAQELVTILELEAGQLISKDELGYRLRDIVLELAERPQLKPGSPLRSEV